MYPSPFQSLLINPAPEVDLGCFLNRYTSTAILAQHPQIHPVERSYRIPPRASFWILGEARPGSLHVATQRVFLGGNVDGWVGTEDERDLSAMVDTGVRNGLDVGEGSIEDEAPGWIAGFDVAGCEKAGNLDVESSETRSDVCDKRVKEGCGRGRYGMRLRYTLIPKFGVDLRYDIVLCIQTSLADRVRGDGIGAQLWLIGKGTF